MLAHLKTESSAAARELRNLTRGKLQRKWSYFINSFLQVLDEDDISIHSIHFLKVSEWEFRQISFRRIWWWRWKAAKVFQLVSVKLIRV